MENIVSFVIPSRNNLKYLKWAYNSIRKNIGYTHEIVLLDDASTDDTWKWLQEINKKDINTIIYRNEGPNRLGHTILYNKGVELASNELFIIGHSDMYYTPDFVDSLLVIHESYNDVISATRVEPPLHPPGPEKIVQDFGSESKEFKEREFLNFVKESFNSDLEVTQGFFAPWLCSKKLFNEVGGHDSLFAPQSREDSDIANRFHLQGANLLQSWAAKVYHLTCRGSRYKDGTGIDSLEWQKTNYKGERNFIRKWGSMIRHDKFLLPVIANKYQIRLTIEIKQETTKNMTEILRLVEPWVTEVLILDSSEYYKPSVDKYIEEEQKITLYNMKERVKYNIREGNLKQLDVEITTDFAELNPSSINMLESVLDSINICNIYSYDNMVVSVNKIRRDYYLENKGLKWKNIK